MKAEATPRGEHAYLHLLGQLMLDGKPRPAARPGLPGTRVVFGRQMRFDVLRELPVLTTKKMHLPSIERELLWFLKGRTDLRYLLEPENPSERCTVWNADGYRWFCQQAPVQDWDMGMEAMYGPYPTSPAEFGERVRTHDAFSRQFGDLGPIYGKQFRNFGGVDQLAEAQRLLREEREGRRCLISLWNPAELDGQALPPCHVLYQFDARPLSVTERFDAWAHELGKDERYFDDYLVFSDATHQRALRVLDDNARPTHALDLFFHCRSQDYLLGTPYNLASAAILLHLMARITPGCQPGELVWSGGNVHLYENHLEQAKEQFRRTPGTPARLQIEKRGQRNLWDFEPGDVSLIGYEPQARIKAPLSVGT